MSRAFASPFSFTEGLGALTSLVDNGSFMWEVSCVGVKSDPFP